MSISASELRLGNYIQDVNGKLEEVESLHIFGGDEINEHSCMGKYNPVPLTEDWLENFGFNRYTPRGSLVAYYSKDKLTICDRNDGQLIIVCAFNHGIRVELKTVHQLQNLFQSLTGNELTLSKPF